MHQKHPSDYPPSHPEIGSHWGGCPLPSFPLTLPFFFFVSVGGTGVREAVTVGVYVEVAVGVKVGVWVAVNVALSVAVEVFVGVAVLVSVAVRVWDTSPVLILTT